MIKTTYYYYLSGTHKKTGETLYYWVKKFPRDARDSGWSNNREIAEKFRTYKDAWNSLQYHVGYKEKLKINKAKVETTVLVTEVPCDVPEGFEKYVESYNSCLRDV